MFSLVHFGLTARDNATIVSSTVSTYIVIEKYLPIIALFINHGSGCVNEKLFIVSFFLGDRLSDDDVDQLLQGQEDAQGNINYEGNNAEL